MKQAFDDNLPRVKPRVRFGTEATTALSELAPTPTEPEHRDVVAPSVDAQRLAQQVLRSPLPAEVTEQPHEPKRGAASEAASVIPKPSATTGASRTKTAPSAPVAETSAQRGDAVDPGAVRREKLRSRLRSLAQNGATYPSGAPDAVLAAAEDLVQELAGSRATASRLESDLRLARRDLEQSVKEAERGRQETGALRSALEEAKALLANLETELTAVEAERDEVLYEVGKLREAESTRTESLANLSHELDDARRQLAEKQSEQEEILNELRQGDLELSALKAEVRRLEEERARNLREIEASAAAQGELRDERGTLSRVHQVLAAARER
jgi:hypothetical protein